MIFKTTRLYTRKLQQADENLFYDMMSNSNVMSLIPQDVLNKEESNLKLRELIELERSSETKIWALCINGSNEFIGIAGFLKNNENQDEIAYRIQEQYWGKGYGTETAKGLIDFGFHILNLELITADVYIENLKSTKILMKFMAKEKEFFNLADNCVDVRYFVKKDNWIQNDIR